MSESTPPLGAPYVRGTLYLGVANWVSYAINFAVTLAIARMLGPASFGLYAFVAAVNEFINIVNGLAVAPALVHSREESDSRYDTAYALSLGQGAVGLLIALAVAPILWANRSVEAAWFIVLLGIVRILKLLSDVAFAKLDRALRYGAIATIHLTTRNVPNFIGLGLAWIGYGPWSLIIRDLFFALFPFLMSHAWSGYRFRGRITRQAFRSIMSYSGPMFVARTVDAFLERFDRLVVGWLFGNTAIGLYHQARFLAETGTLAARPLNQPAFNLYSRLRDDPGRLGRSYSIVNYFLVRLMFAGAAVLLIYPEPTVLLLLGPEWIEAAPILRCLGIYAGLLPLFDNMRTLLYARGRVLTNVRLRLGQLVVFLPGVLIAGYSGSITGVALSLAGAAIVGVGLAWFYNREILRGV
ncbi:MAG: oligosaccharide flippase family protein, partial [Myxococcota bacterium]